MQLWPHLRLELASASTSTAAASASQTSQALPGLVVVVVVVDSAGPLWAEKQQQFQQQFQPCLSVDGSVAAAAAASGERQGCQFNWPDSRQMAAVVAVTAMATLAANSLAQWRCSGIALQSGGC